MSPSNSSRGKPPKQPKEPESGNLHILSRLKAIQDNLMSEHAFGATSSSASKGKDREILISKFLSRALPQQFRFGSGEITDRAGRLSGQLDIVIEFPLWPSLQSQDSGSRLYLAEGVATAIEVKSNLVTQWKEVEATSKKLRPLIRRFGSGSWYAPGFIPLIAVGYRGWKDLAALEQRLTTGVVDGILVIENGLFAWNQRVLSIPELLASATGPWALWGLITCLTKFAHSLSHTSVSPSMYARPDLLLLRWTASESEAPNSETSIPEIAVRAGFEPHEAKRHFEILAKEGLVTTSGEDKVSITEKGIEIARACGVWGLPL